MLQGTSQEPPRDVLAIPRSPFLCPLSHLQHRAGAFLSQQGQAEGLCKPVMLQGIDVAVPDTAGRDAGMWDKGKRHWTKLEINEKSTQGQSGLPRAGGWNR